MHLVDIGANLTHESFRNDLHGVLERARTHGVTTMVVTGASCGSSLAALDLARAHTGTLYATAGVHPHHASEYNADTDALMRDLVATPEVRAAGEAGLDYHRNFSTRDAQLFAFERQLAIAAEHAKPLFLHQRDAHADFIALLRAFRDHVPRAVVHCFTGTRKELFDYLDLDCHIGITGWICDERRGMHLRELVRDIPHDRLMLETDCPYLLPRNLHPMPSHRRNEPMYLTHIAAEVARDRGESVTMLAAATTATARTFFDLPD